MPRLTLSIAIGALLAACGGAQTASPAPATPQPPVAPPPELGGVVLYTAGIAPNDAALNDFWSAVQDQLHDGVPVIASDLDDEGFRTAMRDQVGPWLRRRAEGLSRLVTLAHPLVERDTPDLKVFASAAVGFVVDDMLAQFASVPLPPSLPADEEIRRAYRARLAELTSDFVDLDRDAYAACARQQGAASAGLAAAIQHCTDRVAALQQQIAAQAPPASAPAAARTLPAECENDDTSSAGNWIAPPPNEHAPRETLVRYDDERFTGAERARLLAAVSARLRRVRGVRLVPAADVRTAETLVSERRIDRGGPVCGRAWPLTAVVARRHPNLVLADVGTYCGDDHATNSGPSNSEVCKLQVTFARAGTDDTSRLPTTLVTTVIAPHDAIESWVRAANSLAPAGPDDEADDFGFGGLGTIDNVVYRVRGDHDEEPALRVPEVMNDWDEHTGVVRGMQECATGTGVASYTVRFQVTAAGGVENASVQPRSVNGATETDAIAHCIEDRVRAIAWPCTPDGAPRPVELTICLGR